jgi:internalin A
MQRPRTMRHSSAVLAVLASCGLGVFIGAEPDKKDTPKPLPPEIVKTWRKAGASVGWMKDMPPQPSDGYGYCEPYREKVEPRAVPAFRYHPEKEGQLAKLPDPGVPFGLDAHCCGMSDADLKELAGLKSLQSLNLGGALRLSDAGLKELAPLKKLQALYLFYAPVTDAGLKTLAGLRQVRVLDLSHTRVKDAGLKELVRLRSLQALNLSFTKVTDAGLEELAGLKRLQWLNVDRTNVTARGVAALQKKLPKCNILFTED